MEVVGADERQPDVLKNLLGLDGGMEIWCIMKCPIQVYNSDSI